MRRRTFFLMALAAAAVVAVVGGLAAVACDSEGDAPAPPVTPRPTQVLPTFFVTATPMVAPTPAVVTPVPAADAGRRDCPEGWSAYDDPDDHFSLCFGPELEGVTARTVPPEVGGLSVNIRTPREEADFPPGSGVFLALGWRVSPTFSPEFKFAEHCSTLPILRLQETSVPVEVEIAGRTAVACRATGSDEGSGPPKDVLLLQVPVSFTGDPERGYVNLKLSRSGPDLEAAEAMGNAILDTLVIPDR